MAVQGRRDGGVICCYKATERSFPVVKVTTATTATTTTATNNSTAYILHDFPEGVLCRVGDRDAIISVW